MTVTQASARVANIEQLVGSVSTVAAPPATPPTPTAAPTFQEQLSASATPAPAPVAPHMDGCCCCSGSAQAASTAVATPLPLAALPDGSAGLRALSVAESQVGQAEEPPGSNDGPALVNYRAAVPGAAAGAPWCAYFVSWAAQQAGAPIGDSGTGLGSVQQITDWAQRTGRLVPSTSPPRAGDLILYGDRHVGLVESVETDGSLTTVEGNYRNAVSRVHRSPAEATGFVRL